MSQCGLCSIAAGICCGLGNRATASMAACIAGSSCNDMAEKGYNVCQSDAGTADSGSVAGELELTIVPPTSGQHTMTVMVQSLTFKPGEPDWNNPTTLSGTRFIKKYVAFAGSIFKVGGYYDPPQGGSVWTNQYTNAALKPTAAIWAKFNGQYVAAPTVQSNGLGGSDLYITATPLTAQTDDADGDGFLAHATDPALKDCDDTDAAINPGQVETPDDSADYNCDGDINPKRVGYRLPIPQQSFVPVLADWSHNGKLYSLAWNANGYYEVFMEKPIAATEFVTQYGTGQWDIGWDYSNPGNCKVFVTPSVYLEGPNTLYTLSQLAIGQYTTCHWKVTNLQ